MRRWEGSDYAVAVPLCHCMDAVCARVGRALSLLAEVCLNPL